MQIIPFLTALLSLVALVTSATPDNNGPIRPWTLEYLGLVDGKAFYAEANVTKNWTEAKAYCESVSLTLATVTSLEQVNFLNDTLKQYGINNRFWTAGHESRNISIIEWDDGTDRQEKPDTEVLSNWSFVTFFPYQYCASLQIYYQKLHVMVIGCDDEIWTLCQTGSV